jgi:predicted outer membrane repeat protein
MVVGSNFISNQAVSGTGGALFAAGSDVNLISSNLTGNQAATHGGAVRSEGQATLYPSGSTHFVRNSARESGGAVSLDKSSLKTNEAALFFADNKAGLGGAVSVINEADLLISSGCQTITFAMMWALSSTLLFASPSVFVRRIRNKTRLPKMMIVSDSCW